MIHKNIGLGVITYNRPEYCTQAVRSIPTNQVKEWVVVNDAGFGSQSIKAALDETVGGILIEHFTNKGVGAAKNTAIQYLLAKGCEHIFLMEDDLEIQDAAVFDRYIDTARATGIWHLCYGKVAGNREKIRMTKEYTESTAIDLHYDCQGAFMYIYKGILSYIGAFDEKFKNAYEHIDFTYRCIQANLLPPFWWFADVHDSQELIEVIPGSSEYSSITEKEGYHENVAAGAQYFTSKHGRFVNQIPSATKEEVEKKLEFLKENYSRQTNEA